MAIYHLSVKYVSRNQGRSAVGASAYRAGERLHNKYDGQTHDYTGKRGIVHTEIMLPDHAPPEFADRETLWNAVEKRENQSNSRTAREIEIALPNELSRDEQIKLVREYVRDNFISQNMCADIAIHNGKHEHDKDEDNEITKYDYDIKHNNPHAHILLTDRPLEKNGFAVNKNTDWNKKKSLIAWRKNWADIQNKEFERKGLEMRVSHESNAKRGIDREPTKHLGHKAHTMEQRGIRTERGDENRAIIARNRAKEERERNRQIEREQSRNRDRVRGKEEKIPRAVSKIQDGGANKLINFIQNEDKKGRAKARNHIEEVKTQTEIERKAEEARIIQEEQAQKIKREREERQAERERRRAEEREQNRNRERDRNPELSP